MSQVRTMPGITTESKFSLPSPVGVSVSKATFLAQFELVKHQLSDRPLQRPNRTRPIRIVTNDELRRIAVQNQPPPEWFEGEGERPF